jgi:guanylate kinase
LTTDNSSAPMFLGVVGVSGSGKNSIQEILTREVPWMFSGTRQVTTRNRRPNESCYDFLYEDEYDARVARGLLFARTEFLGRRYGTRTDSVDPDRINVIILNEDGYNNFVADAKEKGWRYFILGLDVENSFTLSLGNREGRDAEFLENERLVLKHADVVFKSDPEYVDNNQKRGKYILPGEVVEMMKQHEPFRERVMEWYNAR